MLPIERLEIVVSEEEASTVKMSELSLPIEKTPTLSTVRKVVVVAAVEEPIEKRYWLKSPKFATRENLANGELVPIPTLPDCVTTKSVPVEEPTTNCGAPLRRPLLFIESSPHGEEVPMPTYPVFIILNNEVVARPAEEDEMLKRTVGSATPLVVVARIENCANGVEVPRPKRPVAESKVKIEPPGLPNLIVEEAERPLVKRRSVEVEFAAVPKLVVGVNGNAAASPAPVT